MAYTIFGPVVDDSNIGSSTRSWRAVINPAALLGVGDVLTIKFMDGTAYTLTDCYIGLLAAGGSGYDFVPGTQVQVTKGGSTSISVASGDNVSDDIDLLVDGTVGLVVAFYDNSSEPRRIGSKPSDTNTWYKDGASSESSLDAVTGYTSHTVFPVIAEIVASTTPCTNGTKETSQVWYSDNGFGAPANLEDGDLATYVQGFTYCCGDFGTAFALCTFTMAVENATAYAAQEGLKLQGSNDTTNGSDGTWADLITFADGVNMTAPASYPGFVGDIVVNSLIAYRYYRLTGSGSTDQVVSEWGLYPATVVVLVKHSSFTDMLYGDLTELHLAISDQPYSVLIPILAFMDHPYGLKLAASMAMYYGDAPALMQISNQYYGDSPGLKKSMVMRYGDLLMLQKTMEMEYSIPFELRQIQEMRYGINGEALKSVMDQVYNLSDFDLIRKKLDMPYLLQSDAMVQTVSTSLTIAGNPVAYSHLNIECSRDNGVITGEAHLADIAQYMQIQDGDMVEAVCNETTYHLAVEHKKRIRQAAASTTFIVSFQSPAMFLSAPWSRPLLQEFDPATAETIINDLAGDLGPVDYQITPFPVVADTLYANDEDRRSIIRKLNQSAGARMQSNPDGTIRIVADYPTAVNKWGDADPAYYMTDERNFVSQDETPMHNSGQNKFLVGNQLSSDERTWTEQQSVSDSEVLVLGFQVPWGSKTVRGLTHSGGDWVHIPEYMGVVEEIFPPLDEPAEQVEFVAGFANSSRPIYGNMEVDWVREQLGSISYAEDGKLEAEVKTGSTDGYSLAEIRYLTRYHLWKVRDDVAEDVQYILWVDE